MYAHKHNALRHSSIRTKSCQAFRLSGFASFQLQHFSVTLVNLIYAQQQDQQINELYLTKVVGSEEDLRTILVKLKICKYTQIYICIYNMYI